MEKALIHVGYVAVLWIYYFLFLRVDQGFTLLSQAPWFFFNTAALIWLLKNHKN